MKRGHLTNWSFRPQMFYSNQSSEQMTFGSHNDCDFECKEPEKKRRKIENQLSLTQVKFASIVHVHAFKILYGIVSWCFF